MWMNIGAVKLYTLHWYYSGATKIQLTFRRNTTAFELFISIPLFLCLVTVLFLLFLFSSALLFPLHPLLAVHLSRCSTHSMILSSVSYIFTVHYSCFLWINFEIILGDLYVPRRLRSVWNPFMKVTSVFFLEWDAVSFEKFLLSSPSFKSWQRTSENVAWLSFGAAGRLLSSWFELSAAAEKAQNLPKCQYLKSGPFRGLRPSMLRLYFSCGANLDNCGPALYRVT